MKIVRTSRKAKHTAKRKKFDWAKPPLTKEGKIDWARVPQRIREEMFSALVPLEEFLNGRIHWMLKAGSAPAGKLEALRSEVIRDLSPITDLSGGGSGRFKRSQKLAAAKRMEAHLEALCEKINSLEGLRPIFEVQAHTLKPNRKLQSRTQGIFSWGAGDWVVGLSFTSDFVSGKILAGLRMRLYALVADGLVTGELARLRQCGYCKRFFIAPEARMTFCPETNHARLYYDRPSQRKE